MSSLELLAVVAQLLSQAEVQSAFSHAEQQLGVFDWKYRLANGPELLMENNFRTLQIVIM